jgi:hypothetical protein
MAGITRQSLRDPAGRVSFGDHGEAVAVAVGDTELWRSTLLPGWSWDVHIKPMAGGAESCPMTHHEYVVAGRIRYLMTDGTEIVAEAEDYLFIGPGHRAWVEGEEPCVLLDW